MTKPTQIFLDVDEVLADWLSDCFDALGYFPDACLAEWAALDPRPWDVFDMLGVLPSVGWSHIHDQGAAFWAGLAIFPWAHDLVALCQSYAPTTLLTSASEDPSCYAGKAQWIAKHMPGTPHLIARGGKTCCAHPGALLIDDSPHNVDAFRSAGGQAILFPGHGNELHQLVQDPMTHVRTMLARAFA